ncbi:methylaspartate mutase [Streptomyces formicae]|uniref:Methylaspartate mutase, E subunit n=1 Tax=Streptomyces formicae TaxID=1616117 RepID=A0A291QGV1_9ACTN|nr:methylaspartate mutase [Streptomyces formicae]ATL31040.1 Methylaspartate mutase, E subunit [Streptomyces formicae]
MSWLDELDVGRGELDTACGGAELPPAAESVAYLRASRKPAVAQVLRAADREARTVVQPRCGVGGHAPMLGLLRTLRGARPGVLSVTIDAYTRLGRFGTARRVLDAEPVALNGYPLVAHGWRRGRELNEAVRVPLEIRHGSPDARVLFAVAISSGISSFEGGGIAYNLPYSKDVPLARSLRAWQRVDAACGRLAEDGVIVDRELFGTLTAVLVPPSISLAVTLLEAVAAAREGVRCLSIAYPQGGDAHQDVAALRSIRVLARRHLPASVEVYPVLHEFMGVFPKDLGTADALVRYGGLVARLGGAVKVINKTNQEAAGVPDGPANAHGIRTAARGVEDAAACVDLDEARVREEMYWIQREVTELVDPVLQGDSLFDDIAAAFRAGTLDIPFSASRHARSAVLPAREPGGAIRYLDPGALPFSPGTRRFHAGRLRGHRDARNLLEGITADINYFLTEEGRASTTSLRATGATGVRTP